MQILTDLPAEQPLGISRRTSKLQVSEGFLLGSAVMLGSLLVRRFAVGKDVPFLFGRVFFVRSNTAQLFGLVWWNLIKEKTTFPRSSQAEDRASKSRFPRLHDLVVFTFRGPVFPKDGIRCCWRVATNYGTWTSSWLCCQGSWDFFCSQGLTVVKSVAVLPFCQVFWVVTLPKTNGWNLKIKTPLKRIFIWTKPPSLGFNMFGPLGV